MSVESMAIALHHSRAAGTAKLVLLGIANHDGDGGAWPSVATLCTYAGGVDRRTVQRAIEQLVDLGEIDRSIMAGGTRVTPDHMRPNLYTFTLTCPPSCDRTKNHRTVESVDNSEAPRGADATPRHPRRPPRGTHAAPPAAPTPPEPSINHPHNPPSASAVVSPEHTSICWSCGKDRAPANARYCTTCSSSGLAQPWIDCDGGCGHVRKRNSPGQQTYTCPDCQKESTPA